MSQWECWSFPLHHWMALLLLSHHHHQPLLPSAQSFSLAPFSLVSSSRGGERLELLECTTRISRSISDTIAFSHLFYMAKPQFPLSPPRFCHSVALCGEFIFSPFALQVRYLLPGTEEERTSSAGLAQIMSRVAHKAVARGSVSVLLWCNWLIMTSFYAQCYSFVTQGGRTRALILWTPMNT